MSEADSVGFVGQNPALERVATPIDYRIGFWQEVLLKASAATLDVVGLILALTVVGEVATEVIGITGDILFFLWFMMLGVDYMGRNARKKLSVMLGNSIMEAIPFVNAVWPGFSVEVWRMVKIIKQEDEEISRGQTQATLRARQIAAQQENRRAMQAAQFQAKQQEERQPETQQPQTPRSAPTRESDEPRASGQSNQHERKPAFDEFAHLKAKGVPTELKAKWRAEHENMKKESSYVPPGYKRPEEWSKEDRQILTHQSFQKRQQLENSRRLLAESTEYKGEVDPSDPSPRARALRQSRARYDALAQDVAANEQAVKEHSNLLAFGNERMRIANENARQKAWNDYERANGLTEAT